VAAPVSGQFVQHRLGGGGVGGDVGDREVGGHEGRHQRGERGGHTQEGADGRALACAGEHGAAPAEQAERGLGQRQGQGQGERERAEFSGHGLS